MKAQDNYNPQEWMTSFMDGCHELVLEHLRPHIQKMFENCNVALLEFSDKAESSTSQIRFMEAGTIVKNNRKNVETIFYRELEQDFSRFKSNSIQGALSIRTGISHPDTGDQDMGNDQLKLISKEETDIHVAIQNMVSTASLGSTHELVAIRQRLAVLNNGRKLTEQQVPAGPESLARAFHKAADGLLLEHELKLIVYLLFDKFVLSKTRALYNEYNARLLKAGLLQNLKYEARKNPVAAQQCPQQGYPQHDTGHQASQNTANSPAGAATHSGESGKSLGDELFDNILELMSRRHPKVEHTPENPMPQTELVSAIHSLQQNSDNNEAQPRVAVTSADPAVNKQAIEGMVANLTAEREQLYQGLDRRRLPTADTQVIDLVGMMFEYMLNDDEIPNVAKAELSRLHTPFLKIAIIDKNFFSDSSHPAQELLNSLARASTRWVFEDNLERGIFPCMRNIVTRIITGFNRDMEIFNEMLDILDASLHDLNNKAVAIEERSRQAADGREKLEIARQCAASTIGKITSAYSVPGAIQQMIEDVWRDKFMFIYLREPGADQSDSWRLATQTVEAILWCVEPRSTPEARTRLQQQRTHVYNQIKQAIQTLSAYGYCDVEAELALVRECSDAALAAAERPATAVSEDDDTRDSCVPEQKVFADADVSETVQTVPRSSRDIPHDSASAAATGTVGASSDTVADTADEAADTLAGEEELSSEIAAALNELDGVSFGTWFSVHQDAGLMPLHAKLSWYSGISGNYMFVDSMGIKVAVFKKRELAGLLVSGKAKIMGEEGRPLIQRAMEAIRRMLGGEQMAQA
jgi:hypothetical protein